MGGDMEVNKNRWVKEWNAVRENLEFNFHFTRHSLAVPILIYKGIVREFVRTRKQAGRTGSSYESRLRWMSRLRAVCKVSVREKESPFGLPHRQQDHKVDLVRATKTR